MTRRIHAKTHDQHYVEIMLTGSLQDEVAIGAIDAMTARRLARYLSTHPDARKKWEADREKLNQLSYPY